MPLIAPPRLGRCELCDKARNPAAPQVPLTGTRLASSRFE
jgi:hypothetical protein